MEIRSKRKFYELWEAGVIGNRTLLWRNVEDIPRNIAKVGFREMGRGGGAWELVPRDQAEATAARWKAAGRNFIMDGSVPNDHSIMQGEVVRTHNGLESFLAIGHGLPPMRQTIAAGLHKHRGSLETRLLLKTYMDPCSQDDLETLLDLYPDSAIEFTCFEVKTGMFPHRSTIFWEIRNY